MRIALAQINPIVGDLPGNVQKILRFVAQARSAGADAVVFPEMALVGYPPRGLLRNADFLERIVDALKNLARDVTGIDVVLGYVHPPDDAGEPAALPLNTVAVLRDGVVARRHVKAVLSDDLVLNESSYFAPAPPANRLPTLDVAGHRVALAIGDLIEPVTALHENETDPRPELLINVAATPFIVGGHDARLERLASLARQTRCPILHVNQVGANDELIFDGNSFALDAQGNIIAHASDFAEDLLLVELPALEPADATPEFSRDDMSDARRMSPGRRENPSRGVESIYHALVLGVRDYVHKCGFPGAILGLSGGIDSALVAAIATAALGADKVIGVAMPSRFSSDHSVADARALAHNLGMSFDLAPIDVPHTAFETVLQQISASSAAPPTGAPDTTDENIQARCRGLLLMAVSNRTGHLVLSTGNKSEVAVGYCTLYGDMCGGLSVIGDVPKTMVYELSNYINHRAGRELIPHGTLTKAPSAELRPGQTDQDSLPPYDVLDAILHRYVELEHAPRRIIAEGFDPALVARIVGMVERAEFKRRQGAPALRISRRGFGSSRLMPMAGRLPEIRVD